MTTSHLYLGCTKQRHQQLGIHAIVNARAGRQDLNDLTIEDIELRRDAQKIRQHEQQRIIIRQFNSKCLRRKHSRVEHLIFKDTV